MNHLYSIMFTNKPISLSLRYNYTGVILLHQFEGGVLSNMYYRKIPVSLRNIQQVRKDLVGLWEASINGKQVRDDSLSRVSNSLPPLR